jgi:RNA polymerase sigma factor (sigma-70 family)
MAQAPLANALRHLRRVIGPGDREDQSDGELLGRFADRGEEAAFAALVQRHGPMVLGVCRRVLENEADAEDAFQATFLVLARRAGSVRKRESVASWLYGVAVHVARRARTAAARRRAHERQVAGVQRQDPLAAVVWRDVRPVLDEELGRLAEKYRAPLVLCYFEGKTHEEAARQLGWTNGTVCGRLARGRALLRDRLVRRGLTLSAAALAGLLSHSGAPAVSPPLAAAATRAAVLAPSGAAAAGLVSARAAVLAAATLRALAAGRLTALAVLVAAGLVVSGAGLFVYAGRAPQSPPPDPPDAAAAVPGEGASRPGLLRLRFPHAVFSVAFSPRSDTLAAAGAGPGVRRWRPATGAELPPLAGHAGEVAAVAFAPGGARLASAGYDGVVKLWDLAGGKELHALRGHTEVVSSLAFSPDGKALASGGWDRTVRL